MFHNYIFRYAMTSWFQRIRANSETRRLIAAAMNYEPESWVQCFHDAGLRPHEADELELLFLSDPVIARRLQRAGLS